MADKVINDVFFSPTVVPGFVAKSLTAAFVSDIIELPRAREIAAQMVWEGATSPVGTFDLLGSLDRVNFAVVASADVSGNSGSVMFDRPCIAFPYLRLGYTPASGTGGSATAYLSGKG